MPAVFANSTMPHRWFLMPCWRTGVWGRWRAVTFQSRSGVRLENPRDCCKDPRQRRRLLEGRRTGADPRGRALQPQQEDEKVPEARLGCGPRGAGSQPHRHRRHDDALGSGAAAQIVRIDPLAPLSVEPQPGNPELPCLATEPDRGPELLSGARSAQALRRREAAAYRQRPAPSFRTPPCSSSPPSRRRWCWSWTAMATIARAAPIWGVATGSIASGRPAS